MRRRLAQYSLKSFLIVFTIVAVFLGLESNRVSKQRKALAILEEVGGSPIYDFVLRRKVVNGRIEAAGPWGPGWLHSLIGVDYFRTVVGLNLADSAISDEELEMLVTLLNKLYYLNLRETKITDKCLGQLCQLPSLEELRLSCTEIGDDGMASIGRCSNLSTLGLSDTDITDSGLAHLQQLSNLEVVHLSFTSVTTDGVCQLLESSTETLRWLNVKHTSVDDGIAQYVQELDGLECINVEETNVSEEGYRIIQESLPDCVIYR